jgi:hypothetical protein
MFPLLCKEGEGRRGLPHLTSPYQREGPYPTYLPLQRGGHFWHRHFDGLGTGAVHDDNFPSFVRRGKGR